MPTKSAKRLMDYMETSICDLYKLDLLKINMHENRNYTKTFAGSLPYRIKKNPSLMIFYKKGLYYEQIWLHELSSNF
jgi:hypothetical protein